MVFFHLIYYNSGQNRRLLYLTPGLTFGFISKLKEISCEPTVAVLALETMAS